MTRRNRGSVLILLIAVAALGLSFAGRSREETHAEAQKPALAPLSYVGSWGMKGDGPGELDQPACIASDALGNVYLADAGSYFIHKFSWRGTPLLSFQQLQLKHPQAITVDSGGAIYIADSGRGSTTIFFPTGDRYRELRLKTKPNAEDMLSVAVADNGTVHVLDPDAGKVSTYGARFRLVRTWMPATVAGGSGVRVRALAEGGDGTLYMIASAANRILRFTDDGALTGTVVAGPGQRLSDQFAVRGGSIFAMDANGLMLHIWTTDGKPRGNVDLAPQLGQAHRSPPALAISVRKELLVLDAPGARVLRYRINF